MIIWTSWKQLSPHIALMIKHVAFYLYLNYLKNNNNREKENTDGISRVVGLFDLTNFNIKETHRLRKKK